MVDGMVPFRAVDERSDNAARDVLRYADRCWCCVVGIWRRRGMWPYGHGYVSRKWMSQERERWGKGAISVCVGFGVDADGKLISSYFSENDPSMTWIFCAKCADEMLTSTYVSWYKSWDELPISISSYSLTATNIGLEVETEDYAWTPSTFSLSEMP